MISNQVDLVVVEGMGRVIHTNLHAKFKCDVLKVVTFFPNFSPVVLESYIKYIQVFFFNTERFVFSIILQVAVIKNRWLAKRFGEQEDTFPVVFQFERKQNS